MKRRGEASHELLYSYKCEVAAIWGLSYSRI